jgi:hypothetical protein
VNTTSVGGSSDVGPHRLGAIGEVHPFFLILVLTSLALAVYSLNLALAIDYHCSSSPYCSFNYNSGTGITGTVVISNNYTLASPVSMTTAGLFFNLTGKTSTLPNNQFKFEAFGTGGSGVIPVTIQTDVAPTSVTPVSYHYANGNVTLVTLNSDTIITVNFSTPTTTQSSSTGGGGSTVTIQTTTFGSSYQITVFVIACVVLLIAFAGYRHHSSMREAWLRHAYVGIV